MCHSRQEGYNNAEGHATGQEAERRARIGKGPMEFHQVYCYLHVL